MNDKTRIFCSYLDEKIASMAPGSRLPTMKTMAGQFGISPVTVQRVLARYKKEGKIDSIPGSGSYIPGGPEGIKADLEPPTTAWQDLAAEVKKLIYSGAVKKSEALPSIKYMSLQYKVTPATVIKAYRSLAGEGFVTKIGKNYWAGDMESTLYDRPHKQIYCFNFRSDDFTQVFKSGFYVKAYQAMYRELLKHGYQVRFESSRALESLAREWRQKGEFPQGLVFVSLLNLKARSIIPSLMKLKAAAEQQRAQLPLLFEWHFSSPLQDLKKTHILHRGTVLSSLTRTAARFISDRQYQEVVYMEDNATVYHWRHLVYLRIKMRLRDLNPDIGFRMLVRLVPGKGTKEDLLRDFAVGYGKELAVADKASAFPAKEEFEKDISFTRELVPKEKPGPGTLWFFPTSGMAVKALKEMKDMGIRVPEDVSVLTFDNDPSHYHWGITYCDPDWERTGYLMAHALIGDFPVARTSHGFIRIPGKVVEGLTTR